MVRSTSTSPRVADNRNAFAEAFSASLSETGTRQADVATSTGTSRAYVNSLATGKKKPSAEWVDMIADVMKLPSAKRVALHRAAASDQGFKLDEG